MALSPSKSPGFESSLMTSLLPNSSVKSTYSQEFTPGRTISLSDVKEKYGAIVGYMFTINSMIAAGVLAFPWAFHRGGWLLGLLVLIVFCSLSYTLSSMIFDIMSRMDLINRLRREGQQIPIQSLFTVFTSKKYYMENRLRHQPRITRRKFDYIEMVGIVFGNTLKKVWLFLICATKISAGVGYCSVFASSMTAVVPTVVYPTCNIYASESFFSECRFVYWFWLAVFYVCMMWYCIKGLSEQAWMQITMATMRYIVILTLMITSILEIAGVTDNWEDWDEVDDTPVILNFSQIGLVIPMVCFALCFQQNFPSISQYVKQKEVNLYKILNLSMLTVLIALGGCGVVVSMATVNPYPMASINWREYSAGYLGRPWWTYPIEYFVVLFPACEAFSIYPIVNIIMSDNILGVIHDANEKPNIQYSIYFIWRAVCCSLPFLIAFFFYDLSGILNWSGLLYILMTYIGLPILFIATRKLVPGHSHYSSSLTTVPVAYFALVLAIIVWVYCAIIMIQASI